MNSETDPNRLSAERLARLVSAADGPEGLWRREELGAILSHQLNAPVEFELGEIGQQIQFSAEATDLASVHSFKELFEHRNPPLKLLRMTKEFAKAHLVHPETTLVKEVASALYYASIALALTRHGTRITQLKNDSLIRGFQWCLAQPWMEKHLQLLFSEGVHYLTHQCGTPA